MTRVEIICLANSKKHGGRCIAGIRTDEKGWIRPIGRNDDHGALFPEDYILIDGSEPRKLSVIEIGISTPKPKPYQPENWLIETIPWRLVSNSLNQSHLRLIKNAFFQGDNLFGTTSDRIPYIQLEQYPAKSSLEIIQPVGVKWVIKNNYSGNRQIRAIFYLHNVEYDLVVTDLDWLKKLAQFDLGYYTSEDIGLPQQVKFLFTISLGVPYNGDCYKLVAAVIPYFPQ
ncbi:dual OB domain-containing protein [Cyanobacterium aponinum]|uniref:Dual OB-containing domain-containing protein n=1 Tax=Cyanobacterium aponinum 0216 TaxID=2676140 RepID=A0A844GZR9_9CHRO|nr:hypothetical protein [Cyanobacterium aponinum]MTF39635.1 hypothetical protein [Cyanobacterium aponinum 0216]PHV63833.1 hypothetical protein CSQ80_03225 [Cyanobacterium aponinum IPPAS B-1201]